MEGTAPSPRREPCSISLSRHAFGSIFAQDFGLHPRGLPSWDPTCGDVTDGEHHHDSRQVNQAFKRRRLQLLAPAVNRLSNEHPSPSLSFMRTPDGILQLQHVSVRCRVPVSPLCVQQAIFFFQKRRTSNRAGLSSLLPFLPWPHKRGPVLSVLANCPVACEKETNRKRGERKPNAPTLSCLATTTFCPAHQQRIPPWPLRLLSISTSQPPIKIHVGNLACRAIFKALQSGVAGS